MPSTAALEEIKKIIESVVSLVHDTDKEADYFAMEAGVTHLAMKGIEGVLHADEESRRMSKETDEFLAKLKPEPNWGDWGGIKGSQPLVVLEASCGDMKISLGGDGPLIWSEIEKMAVREHCGLAVFEKDGTVLDYHPAYLDGLREVVSKLQKILPASTLQT